MYSHERTASSSVLSGDTVSTFERERQRRPERRRQALVVFSDGVDTSSHVDYDDIVALARALDVTIYTITLQKQTPDEIVPFDYHSPRRLMKTLSVESGGQAFVATQTAEMRPIYDTIARELVSQYALAYVAPPGGDGPSFRRVSVRLVPPTRGVARTRAGYTVRPRVRGSH